MDIGRMYPPDDGFKARARLHQARFRADVLGVECEMYGNRLKKNDGEALVIYYDKLGVREAKTRRFPEYSPERDADMLRSEHIPFNMFGPLQVLPQLAAQVFGRMIGRQCLDLLEFEFEWAPQERNLYLDDRTAFDVFACFRDEQRRRVGIGVEVKYTEHGYSIGATEAKRVADRCSLYWRVTRESGAFLNDGEERLAFDGLRQIWRNHLLGLAMRLRGDLDDFISITLYPAGNTHFTAAFAEYRGLLSDHARDSVLAYTYEDFIDGLSGDEAVMDWKDYLQSRYLV
jgi:hypothetical protein